MTSRERTLAVLLGSFIGLMVLGGAGYLLAYLPIADKKAEARKLEGEIAEKQDKLLAIQKNRPRLEAALKRSLPANPEVARQEYDTALTRLLREARVPATSFAVKQRQADGRAAPELAAKKPAYTRVVMEITLKKIDFATLIDVLQRYYRLNLLQQITKFTVKRVEEGGTTASRRGGFGGGFSAAQKADKPDLEVTILTEAIILDGAENRRSLLPVSVGFAAAGGGAGYGAIQQSEGPARGLNPLQFTRVLASMDREYPAMLAKDVFHGPLPPPQTVAPKEKEDTSEFIRLTGVGRNSDGTGVAFIEDVASNQEYAVELTRVKGKLTPHVVKHYYTTKGAKKAYPPEADLDISEATSSTARKFRVLGIDADGATLLLAALDGKGGAAPKFEAKGGFPAKRPGPSAFRPTAPPGAAVAGGVVAGLPVETVYAWKAGESLKHVTALSPTEGQKALARATAAGPIGEQTTPASATGPRDPEAAVGERDD